MNKLWYVHTTEKYAVNKNELTIYSDPERYL